MDSTSLLEKILVNLKQLPENELLEIHKFGEFLLAKIQQKLLAKEVSKTNTYTKSCKFLEEDTDLYTVNDLKVKYRK